MAMPDYECPEAQLRHAVPGLLGIMYLNWKTPFARVAEVQTKSRIGF